MKTLLKYSYLIFLLLTTTIFAQNKTNVMVLGTIHKYHSIDPNYSYLDLINIINSFKPDVICLEIRPEDFRKKDVYPKEMYLATIYGMNNNIPVEPIDWWKEGIHKKQKEMMKSNDIIKKESLEDSLYKNDSLIQSFEKKYGTYDELNKKNYDYYFWNGKDFNNYIAETYKISMNIFGDSPMNLLYETRNNNMMTLINRVINKNEGKRILIITGAEHKHYFDRKLSENKTVNLMQLEDFNIKNIDEKKLDKNTFNCLEYGLCISYFKKGTIDEDVYYLHILMPLLHGSKMDFNPSIIPENNIKKALNILNIWTPSHNYEIFKTFETAWIKYINKNYTESLKLFLTTKEHIDLIKENDKIGNFLKKFYIISIYRNLGLNYYKINDSKEGDLMFEKGKKLFKDFGMPPKIRDLLFNKEI